MSQRDSGYARKERDLYETPEWATLALLPHLPRQKPIAIWEPACGSGKMVRALTKFGDVLGTDIDIAGNDFLKCIVSPWHKPIDAIITNPPYILAREFIEHALRLMNPTGLVAMLLRTDYDHAAGRKHLFADPSFAKKVVLRKRIQWFEDSKGSPSFNHAWFIWDHQHQGAPTLAYGP
jgi:hypothetical protein